MRVAGYALAAAACGYVHYYGLAFVGLQLAFALVVLLRGGRSPGFLLAACRLARAAGRLLAARSKFSIPSLMP